MRLLACPICGRTPRFDHTSGGWHWLHIHNDATPPMRMQGWGRTLAEAQASWNARIGDYEEEQR